MSLSSVIAAHKLTIGLIALGTIALGGTTAAAYADALPSGLQDEAHALIGAPTADPTTDPTAPPTAEPTDSATDTATPTPEPTTDPTSTAVPVGPDASGPAAHGLCTAYEHGGLAATSVAYASLEKAAGGAAAIDAYCATIVAPGNSGAHQPAPAPTGAPTVAGAPSEHGHGDSKNAGGSSHAGGGHGRP
ncbi:protein tyrosine phosphatase [Microbacterium sp. X-17]|uniref:protein tyrosine phosphatase n=1 Tax=Microbacterium sp. X-17 TaxID=3144404 RepID=UPI0031F56146